MLSVATVLALVLVLATLVYYTVAVRPWLVLPDEPEASINDRWIQVERWAEITDDTDFCARVDMRKILEETQSSLDGPDAASAVPGILRKAQKLRQSTSLVGAALGFAMADEAVTWASEQDGAPLPAFRRYRPRAEEYFFAFARNAVCLQRSVDAQEELSFPRSDFAAIYNRPFVVDGLQVVHREKLWLKKYNADELHALYPIRDDLSAMLEEMQYDPDEVPRSMLVRVSLFVPYFLEDGVQTLDAFDKLVSQ